MYISRYKHNYQGFYEKISHEMFINWVRTARTDVGYFRNEYMQEDSDVSIEI